MSGAGAAVGAFDATVYTDGSAEGDMTALRKTRAAVAYFERELDVARDAAEKAEEKVDKFAERLAEVQAGVPAAEAEVRAAAVRLADARRQLQEMGG